MFFAPIECQPLRRLDVRRLRTLVAAAQQDDDLAAAPHEIDPIAGPIIDPQFADALPHRFHISRIPKSQPIKPGRDQGPRPAILEAHSPSPESLCLLEFDHCGDCSL